MKNFSLVAILILSGVAFGAPEKTLSEPEVTRFATGNRVTSLAKVTDTAEDRVCYVAAVDTPSAPAHVVCFDKKKKD